MILGNHGFHRFKDTFPRIRGGDPIEYALKGELTHGKIKTSVVQMIEGSLNAEPTIAPESLQPLTYNENRDYIDCDEFICHKCGIHVEDWKQIKIDPDDGEKELCEYKFKHCPECGAKVTSHKSCEFCRWHLQVAFAGRDVFQQTSFSARDRPGSCLLELGGT